MILELCRCSGLPDHDHYRPATAEDAGRFEFQYIGQMIWDLDDIGRVSVDWRAVARALGEELPPRRREEDSLDPGRYPPRSLRDLVGRYDTIGEPIHSCCDCLDCGAVVRDRPLHDEWHARLERRVSRSQVLPGEH